MALAAEKELEHIGETCGCADHDHDLIHDLSKRLDALWRYDQYIANAEGEAALQQLERGFVVDLQVTRMPGEDERAGERGHQQQPNALERYKPDQEGAVSCLPLHRLPVVSHQLSVVSGQH